MKKSLTNRKNCINIPTCTYTGNEMSPLRYGYSAEGFELNYEKEGHDKLIWFVKMKNNKKVWVRKYNIDKVTHEETIIKEKPIDLIEIMKEIVVEKEVAVDAPVKDYNEKTNIIEKKCSNNYNLFLKYHLKKLKNENTANEKSNVLFNRTIEEWKRLKKNPNELKIILDKIKEEEGNVTSSN